MENARVTVGLRRNKQRREWPGYREALCKAAGIVESDVVLVEAEDSIRFEKELFSKIENGIQGGFVERKSELSREEAIRRVGHCIPKIVADALIVWPCHGANFAFKLERDLLVNCAFRILDFDRDTIYAATDNINCGIGIDVYESELTKKRRYTVDFWLS